MKIDCNDEAANTVDLCKNKTIEGNSLNCCYMKYKVDDNTGYQCIAVKKEKDIINEIIDKSEDDFKVESIDCDSMFIKFSFTLLLIFNLF